MSNTKQNIEHEVTKVDIIISKGDEAGNITYANPIFIKLSGYTQAELLEKPHSIVRHPDMPKVIFKYIWSSLQAGKDVNAFVKNLSKDGSFYWVYAHIRVAKNPDGSFRNYVSTRRTMSANARAIIEPLYEKMIEAENSTGLKDSLAILEEFLSSNNATLSTFNETMKNINI